MKKLHKSNSQKMICGVCGGIAEYFGIDVNHCQTGRGRFGSHRRQRPAAVFPGGDHHAGGVRREPIRGRSLD